MQTQLSFSTLWDGYESNEQAKQARNVKLKQLRRDGCSCTSWVLVNQTKQYHCIGMPDGRSCNVYMITITDRVDECII